MILSFFSLLWSSVHGLKTDPAYLLVLAPSVQGLEMEAFQADILLDPYVSEVTL